jgi:hypothetical protein
MRYNVLVPGNTEFIWSDSRLDNRYGLAVKSLPHVESQAWNGVGPTLAMLRRFYTENGLPVDKDPEFYGEDEWWHVESRAEVDTSISAEQTMYFNKKREPRYYAWIAFQGAFYELMSATSNGAYDADPSYQRWGPGRLSCNFVVGGNTSRGSSLDNLRGNDFSPSGFLNKKFVPSSMIVGKDAINLTPIYEATWPIIRLADLYLMYAEACVETEDLSEVKKYVDKVRVRAGIPTIDESWNRPGVGGANTKEILHGIVRQERQVELYLENQNFWDMRRWLLAANAFEGFAQGMNADGVRLDVTNSSVDRYNQVVDARGSGGIHHFANPTHYFLPIPLGDVNRNPQVTQNPGY